MRNFDAWLLSVQRWWSERSRSDFFKLGIFVGALLQFLVLTFVVK